RTSCSLGFRACPRHIAGSCHAARMARRASPPFGPPSVSSFDRCLCAATIKAEAGAGGVRRAIVPKRQTGKRWGEARAKAARALAAMTDEEDAELTRAAIADPDNPPLADADFGKMRPAVDVAPEIVRRAR